MSHLTFKIIFLILLILIFIISTYMIFGKKNSLLLTSQQWTELFVGTILIGIYMGIIRSNILGLNNGNEIFILAGSFFMFWYLLTKVFSNAFTIQTPLYQSEQNNLITATN